MVRLQKSRGAGGTAALHVMTFTSPAAGATLDFAAASPGAADKLFLTGLSPGVALGWATVTSGSTEFGRHQLTV